MFAAIGGVGTTLYNVVFLLHLVTVIVGFGSSFVWPMLGSQARKLGPGEPALAVGRAAFTSSTVLTTYFVYAAGVTGVLLVVVSGETWKFSQMWITLAFALFIVGAVLGALLHTNNKKMLGLQERLVSGQAQGGPDGPPPEVAEIEKIGPRMAMFGGLAHLAFLLMVIDMIWKPGIG